MAQTQESKIKSVTDMKQVIDYQEIKSNIKRGLFFGEKGKFNAGGDKAQCHICGEFYKSVASHSRQTHGINADEYRELFSLNISQGLVSKTLARRQSEITTSLQNRGILNRFNGPNKEGIAASKKTRGRPQRKESVLHNKESHPTTYVSKICTVCGKSFLVPLRYWKRRFTCSLACRRQSNVRRGEIQGGKMARRFWDEIFPSWPEEKQLEYRKMRADNAAKVPVEATCFVCGKKWFVPPSKIRYKNGVALPVTCSNECWRISKSIQQKGKKENITPEQHRKRSESAKKRWAERKSSLITEGKQR